MLNFFFFLFFVSIFVARWFALADYSRAVQCLANVARQHVHQLVAASARQECHSALEQRNIVAKARGGGGRRGQQVATATATAGPAGRRLSRRHAVRLACAALATRTGLVAGRAAAAAVRVLAIVAIGAAHTVQLANERLGAR